jgi:hypothetical protein
MKVFKICLIVLLALPAWAEDDESSREDEMFGGEEEKEEALISDKTIAEKLEEEEKKMAIGGEVYMRFQYNVVDQGDPEEFLFQSPNLLHLYLDGRPNEHLRAFVRGRLMFDFTVEEGDTNIYGQQLEPLEVFLDQFWLKFDIARAVYVTVGRQPVRWGSGRFWNPTDFLNQQRRDPLAIFDERLGASLLKIHIPVESLGWNFYVVANLEGAESPEEIGGALRAEMLIGEMAEVAATVAFRKDQPLRLGLDASFGIWDLDIRTEAAVLHGEEKLFYRGTFDPVRMILPESYTREDDWIPQITAALEYTFLYSDQDSLILGIEYFYNNAGCTNSKLYPWLAMNGDLVPFYVGQQYASAYAVLMYPGDWNDTTFILSYIGNLSDGTWLTRLDYQVKLLTYLELDVFAMLHIGDRGEFRYEVNIPEGTPFVEDGLTIPAQRLELGLWLRLSI